MTGDEARLREVFHPIVAYHRWLHLNRDPAIGIVLVYRLRIGKCRSTVPQRLYHHRHWHGWMPPCKPIPAHFCWAGWRNFWAKGKLLKNSAERSILGRRINATMWDEETSFYYPTDPNGDFSNVRTMAAYWALLDKQLVPEDRRTIRPGIA
ncbi:MAG: hypothetical protein R3C44_16485 [Chloroflexota bacterium]